MTPGEKRRKAREAAAAERERPRVSPIKVARFVGAVAVAAFQTWLAYEYGDPALLPYPDAMLADDLKALGLAEVPDAEGLAAAWRETALRTHPDRGGDAGAFRRAKDAHERLRLRTSVGTTTKEG